MRSSRAISGGMGNSGISVEEFVYLGATLTLTLATTLAQGCQRPEGQNPLGKNPLGKSAKSAKIR